jgi:predicted TIM-barrel fold metal-dependent hydrolase
MSKKILLISGDGHVGAMPEDYRPYLDPAHRSAIDDLKAENDEFMSNTILQTRYSKGQLDLIDEREAIRSGGGAGVDDVGRRLKELDGEGIAAELLIPGHQFATLPFFSMINKPVSPELRAAGARAYHRWLADMMAQAGGRLVGLGEAGPCLDMDATVEELRWIAEHGFVSVQPPGSTGDPNLPPYGDAHYEPFWSACEDLGLVLTAHAGFAAPQRDRGALMSAGGMPAFSDSVPEEEKHAMRTGNKADPALTRRFLYTVRRFLGQMMSGGVLDRHPKLKVVITECRADWVPATIVQMDKEFAAGGLSLKVKPSEYWARHFYVTPSSPRKYEVEMRHEIGLTKLMFGTDYPHPEGTWPNTQDWIRAAFDGVPEAEARLILGENAVACYGLDLALLEKVADRIGPEPSDLLGAAKRVKPELIADFHKRSDYGSPPEAVDISHVRDFFRKEERMFIE